MRFAALLSILFLIACGDDPVAPKVEHGPLHGAWSGALADGAISVTLDHDADSNGLAGDGVLVLSARNVPVTAHGAFAAPTYVTILFIADGYPIQFTGTFEDSVIAGSVNGYGYVHRTIRFRRAQ